MKPRRSRCGAVALALGLLTAAAAMAAPVLEDPEATVVPELVVRSVLPGPAWWTVRKGDRVVYILGLPDEPMPKGMKWDQAALERRLMGASALIAPVEPKAGLGDIPAFLGMLKALKSHTPMEQGLPDPLRIRFVAARTRLGEPASRYAGWDAILAGQVLVNDFQGAAHMNTKEPLAAVRRAAGRAGVSIRPAASFRVVGLLNPAIRNLTPEISQACLAEALDEVDAGEGALDTAASAWAHGDVRGVLAGPRGFATCLLLLHGGATFWRQTMDDYADAVAAALDRPGHAVAAFPIRSLLAENGVLERLKARGLEVTGGRD